MGVHASARELLVDGLLGVAGGAEFDEGEVDAVLLLEGDLHDGAVEPEVRFQLRFRALGNAESTSELRLEM